MNNYDYQRQELTKIILAARRAKHGLKRTTAKSRKARFQGAIQFEQGIRNISDSLSNLKSNMAR